MSLYHVAYWFQVVLITIYIMIATWSSDYLIDVILDKDIPIFVDIIIGIIAGSITIPMAIVVWIIMQF